jgi:hypothetical protein
MRWSKSDNLPNCISPLAQMSYLRANDGYFSIIALLLEYQNSCNTFSLTCDFYTLVTNNWPTALPTASPRMRWSKSDNLPNCISPLAQMSYLRPNDGYFSIIALLLEYQNSCNTFSLTCDFYTLITNDLPTAFPSASSRLRWCKSRFHTE